ncbi:MAG: HAMP domain-containing sensor histidine kinase [Pseudomonadota bacterium]
MSAPEDDAQARLERFSYAAAHDLKSPLRNINLVLEFLLEDHGADLAPEAREYITEAQVQVVRLQNLTEAMMAQARAAGPFESGLVSLDEVVDGAWAALSNVAEGASFSRPPSLGEVRGDGALLASLWGNLLHNALVHRDPARALRITLTAHHAEGALAALDLRDTGQGFDPSACEAIFEPFRHRAPDRALGDHGLALSIARAVAARHGWGLRATGMPGEGSVFRVVLSPGSALDRDPPWEPD